MYSPVKNAKAEQAKGNDPYQPKPKDAPGVGKWWTYMGTDDAKTIHQRRAQTAEWANARVRNMGLRAFLVRGLEKVRAVAMAHHLIQTLLLKAKAAAA